MFNDHAPLLRRSTFVRGGLALATAAALSACGGLPRRAAAVPSSPYGNDVAIQALGLVGTPYRLGGTDLAQGVDCSAFIGLVYRRASGVPTPRTVAALQHWGRSIDRDAIEAGDVILFIPDRSGTPTHGGVVVGGARFVHAPSTGGKVRVDSLELPYWARQRWIIRRPG